MIKLACPHTSFLGGYPLWQLRCPLWVKRQRRSFDHDKGFTRSPKVTSLYESNILTDLQADDPLRSLTYGKNVFCHMSALITHLMCKRYFPCILRRHIFGGILEFDHAICFLKKLKGINSSILAASERCGNFVEAWGQHQFIDDSAKSDSVSSSPINSLEKKIFASHPREKREPV